MLNRKQVIKLLKKMCREARTKKMDIQDETWLNGQIDGLWLVLNQKSDAGGDFYHPKFKS